MTKIFKLLSAIVALVIGAVVSAMTGENSYKESDGRAVNVDLLYTVDTGQVAYVDGWLGVMSASGDSGDERALDINPIERQFTVPSGLSVSKGDIVYIDITDLTGHIPDDAAYSTSAGSNKVAYFKATADKDDNDVVTGVVLPGNLAS